MIYLVPSEDQWLRTGQDEVDPPTVRATPGRPKKVRRRGSDEPRNPHCMRKGGVTMRCSKCRAAGHNARTCPRRQRVSTQSSSRASIPTSTATELTQLTFDDVSLFPKYMFNKMPLPTELMILLTLFVLCCRFLLSQFLMIHSLHSSLHLHSLFQGPKKDMHLLLLL
jgi:hypothetical protein